MPWNKANQTKLTKTNTSTPLFLGDLKIQLTLTRISLLFSQYRYLPTSLLTENYYMDLLTRRVLFSLNSRCHPHDTTSHSYLQITIHNCHLRHSSLFHGIPDKLYLIAPGPPDEIMNSVTSSLFQLLFTSNLFSSSDLLLKMLKYHLTETLGTGSGISRFGLVWFGLVLWQINHCSLFNAKSCLFMYIRY